MNTFLPYPSVIESSQCLDYRRLGKQRVEAWQILNTLLGKSDGWKNHPAVKQWKGYEHYLAWYGYEMCTEWINRGYKDTLRPKFLAVNKTIKDMAFPDWLGDEAYHASHRSNLLRKDAKWYGQFGWTESNDLPYVWPSNMEIVQNGQFQVNA
jgi:hypothetical protein